VPGGSSHRQTARTRQLCLLSLWMNSSAWAAAGVELADVHDPVETTGSCA
jgi:hypothetical protein